MDTLGDALPREMARDAAAKALAEGDVAAMIRAYEALKGYST